jgi:manganese/zinc/iron transport system permease protein
MSLLGDAISHAVLPGIAIAFLATGHRSTLPMLLGAGALGVLTVFLVDLLNRTRRLKEDASIGVVFPALFSIGVILISRYAYQIDLDLDCVLYGEIAYAPYDLLTLFGAEVGSRALWTTGGVLAIDLLVLSLFYKELKLATFDEGLAHALGYSPVVLHYLLMSLVSITVVGSFESVGAILVVAMLVAPPATAYLLTERLSHMIALAVGLGILSAWGGYGIARTLDASIAGAMATVAGALFLAALLASPRHGVLARVFRHRRVGENVAEKLLLAHLREDEALSIDELRHRFNWSDARFGRTVARLERGGLVLRRDGGLVLSGRGSELLDRARLPRHREEAGVTTP